MFRSYLTAALIALAGFGYAQVQGWSMFSADTEQVAKARPGFTPRHK